MRLPSHTPRISIHAPRAGSDGCVRGFLRNRFISIHAPRAGSDKETDSEIRIPVHFNPRSPCGERPVHVTKSGTLYRFQSTLPVRGATRPLRFCAASNLHFNPRSPCGERRATRRKISCCMKFQSTLPVRGATINNHILPYIGDISIHAPRAGSDEMRRND